MALISVWDLQSNRLTELILRDVEVEFRIVGGETSVLETSQPGRHLMKDRPRFLALIHLLFINR